MHAYVISLVRSADRRAHMVSQLARTQLQYTIVDAVDGRDLDTTDRELFDPSADSTFSPGIFGCVLSHLKVYRKILEDDLDVALVLEDDIVLPADLAALADAIAPQLTGAEVVLLNYHSQGACRITEAGKVALPSARRLMQVADMGSPFSGGAYLITRQACARMAGFVLPVRSRADYWERFYRSGAIDRVRCVLPMPVDNSVVLRTTKDNFRPGSAQARLLEIVAAIRIPVVYQLLALRRRRHLRRYSRSGITELVIQMPDGSAPPLMWRSGSPGTDEAEGNAYARGH